MLQALDSDGSDESYVGRLRGYTGSASLFSYSSGSALLLRHPSSPKAAEQHDQAPLLSAHQALRAGVALCQRHSLETSQEMAHQLWFDLLQVRVLMLLRGSFVLQSTAGILLATDSSNKCKPSTKIACGNAQ